MADLPIEFTQLANLPSLGIDPKFLEVRSTTFESDKYVLVKETTPEGGNAVSIIDLKNNASIDRKNMGGDNAIMHPTKNVISVRANGTIGQIFNLDTKEKLKAFTMNDAIVFWKWLSDDVLGLVTVNSIYTLNVFDGQVNGGPVKLTDRHPSLQQCQIIDFTTNENLDWLAVVGIYQTEQSTIGGKIQLFNKTRNVSQLIDGHACQFSKILLEGNSAKNQVFVIANNDDLKIIEIEHNPNVTPVAFSKKQSSIFFPDDAATDFPLSCKISEKYGIVYILTKFGYIHLYELETCTDLFVNRISAQPVFTTTYYNNKNGIATINREGQVLAVEIEKDAIVPYVLNKLNDVSLALKIASRGNLPGAESLFAKQFDQLIAKGDYSEAAKCAANSGVLRNVGTINKLKSLPASSGTPPLLIYFSTLLEKGKLNQFETIELAKPILQQDRKQLLEKWIKEEKLECTEELGDIVKPYDTTLALACYLRANVHMKVLTSLVELQQFDKIIPYCQKVSFKPNFSSLISQLILTSPDKASEFAVSLLNSNVDLDLESIADLFFKNGKIQQGTSFLLDALKQDLPEHGHLQTRLLEINLLQAPQVADAIFASNMCHHYDKQSIAPLCEKAGLYQRALENYSDLKDYKRCITHVGALPMDWILQFFSNLSDRDMLSLLRTLMDSIDSQNKQTVLSIVVQVATRFSDIIGSTTLIKFFEEYKSDEGLYYFLSSIVNITDDPEVVYKYIQAAANSGNVKEVERIVRENNIYDGEKVKNFLKDANLDDQLPLAIVCDKYHFTHELILYLYHKENFKFIEIYVQQVNPSRTPQVVAALLDVGCEEKIIQDLIKTVASSNLIPISELCDEVEKRSKLKLLLPFLENVINSGSSNDQVVYNTLAKIYIDSNNNPEEFLRDNSLYDCAEVGKYCEKRDPQLACIAYEKGDNSADFIRVTTDNSMFKEQAKYLLKKCDSMLWDTVLTEENENRKPLTDAVIAYGVSEFTDPEPIFIAVKAFMSNDLKTELIKLLEKIVLEESPFSSNSNLQNLLMVSAIKYDTSRVSSYIEKLEKYDPEEIGTLCVENDLNEEAFEIYNTHELYSKAMKVILDNMMSLDRGLEYASKVDKSDLWSQLGEAQLNGLRVSEAIESYTKAEDPSNYDNVIDIAEHSEKYDDLLTYLHMARKTLKEPKIDNTIILVLAHLGKLNEVEKFLKGSNAANLDTVGDKLIEKGDYKASKMCFSSVSNYSKLATTFVHLGEYQEAVDAARKASNVGVWKTVCDVCIEKKEFKLAQVCGLNIIIHAEELPEIVNKYESLGYFEELIALFEAGLGLERAHKAMFTQLAVLYTKYNPGKTYDYLKLFWSRINVPMVVRAVQQAHLWPELIFLYAHSDEWDNAALTVIESSTDNFDHLYFKDIIVQVANLEIYYKAINFYVENHPNVLVDLLTALTPRLDIARTVKLFRNSDNLPLIKAFLINVLPQNLAVVNEAYHELLIEEHDYVSLKSVVDSYDKFDQLALAKQLEDHEVIFFKQIAAQLYCRNKKWERSLSILKEQRLWKDAINVATLSQNKEVAEDLLSYFITTGNREAVVAMLYSAYNLISYDFILEEAWLNDLENLIKPYEISVKKEQFDLVQKLSKKLDDSSLEDNEESKLMLTNGPSF